MEQTFANFVRGSLIFVSMAVTSLKPALGSVNAAIWVGVIVFAIAGIALWNLEETFHKDLNYIED